MSGHTFTGWLYHEVTAARCALLALYEQKDRLLYVEGPQIENSICRPWASLNEG